MNLLIHFFFWKIQGAETIVELWLNIPNTLDAQDDNEDSEQSAECSQNTSQAQITQKPTNQIITAPSEPIPSTSAQSSVAFVSNQPILNLPNAMPIKHEPGVSVNVPVQSASINNYLSTLVPQVKQKIEPPSIVAQNIAGPSKPGPTISDQNYANVSDASNQSITNSGSMVVPKATTSKHFIKCVSKDGKISLMQLVQDQSNPKLFKMVLPKNISTNRINVQQQQHQQSPAINTVKLLKPLSTPLTQPIKITPMLANTLNGKGPMVRNSLGDPTNAGISNTNTPMTIKSENKSNLSINGTNSSLNSPNKSTALPKIVAINSPKPTLLKIPPTSTVSQVIRPIPVTQTTTPIPRNTSLPPGVRIIKRNNKILVLDSKPVQKRPQQSLLKPQISLLKPRPTTSSVQSLKKITVSNITGMEHKNINVFVPNNLENAPKSMFKPKNTPCIIRQNFSDQLEKRFFARTTFTCMTEAIAWLMKAIPLVSSLAVQPDYRDSFPFIVPTMDEFCSLMVTKQRCFEVIFKKNFRKEKEIGANTQLN